MLEDLGGKSLRFSTSQQITFVLHFSPIKEQDLPGCAVLKRMLIYTPTCIFIATLVITGQWLHKQTGILHPTLADNGCL